MIEEYNRKMLFSSLNQVVDTRGSEEGEVVKRGRAESESRRRCGGDKTNKQRYIDVFHAEKDK